MKRLFVVLLGYVAACLSGLALAPLPVAIAVDDVVTEFNGQDLAGWQTEGNWVVEPEGVIALRPRPGEGGWQRFASYLWAKQQYADFVFDLEYRMQQGANSGAFVRVGDRKNPVRTGIEVQIDTSRGVGHHANAGILFTTGATKQTAKPLGEWNHMKVTCQGSNLRVWLNGMTVVDLKLDKSKMSDRPLQGYVGLQDHGKPIEFRNLKITPLK
jgi:hypothetical protein